MTHDNTIDAEITHVEENDEMVPIEDAQTSAVKIVSPDEFLAMRVAEAKARHRAPDLVELHQERVGTELARQPSKEIAVITNADDLDFQEDYAMLRMFYNKIFRRAIMDDVALDDAIDIEEQVREELGQELIDAVTDLNDARDGKTDLDWRLSEWRKELAAI